VCLSQLRTRLPFTVICLKHVYSILYATVHFLYDIYVVHDLCMKIKGLLLAIALLT